MITRVWEFQFVVTAGGPLHRPKLPDLEGIEKFKGHEFRGFGKRVWLRVDRLAHFSTLSSIDYPGLRNLNNQPDTARWDYAWTGGDDEENYGKLVNLKDKRVALIGTVSGYKFVFPN